MGFFPDLFVDDVIKARQDALDGQWKSLKTSFTLCNNTPDSSFAEFTNDFTNWSDFYASGSNWSSSSKHATDEWQTKALEWTNRLRSWGCTGNVNNYDVISATGDTQAGIPTVRPNPADDKTFLQNAADAATALTQPARDAAATVGWAVVGLVVLVIVALAYVLTRGKASGYGVKVGS